MKITKQTSDEMTLEQGRTTGIVTSIVLMVIGLVVLYFGYPSLGGIFISIVFFIVGIFGALLTPALSINIDKKSGKIVSATKSIIGFGKSNSYDIGDVAKIEIKRVWREAITSGAKTMHSIPALMVQPVIVFKDKRELLIGREGPSSQFRGAGIFGKPVALEAAEPLNRPLSKLLKIGRSPTGTAGTLISGEEEITKILKPAAAFLNVPIAETDPGPNKWIADKR
jgi:hypothetical protein